MKETTFLIRTYNSALTVKAALDSALQQTVPPSEYEVLVIDDGSTDDTEQLLQAYQESITLVASPHLGPINALNTALAHISTPYFMILDSDDRVEPDIVANLLTPLLAKPELGFTYCDYFEHDLHQQTNTITTDNIFNTIAGGILFDTTLVRELGGYDPALFFPEYDLLIKLLQTVPGLRVAKPLYHYLRRTGSVTDDQTAVGVGRQQLKVKYGQDYPIRNYDLS
jgi:glycosyltransferase involved in cell wall biosynthesis